MSYLGIIITYVFISNVILSQFLGLCPFIGVSKNVESALGMGFAVTFVMSIASLVTWALYHLILLPLGLIYLQTIVFILIIASLVQLVEMVVQKYSPILYKALGIYLPLITTNCAVMGIALINVNSGYNLLESFTAGFFRRSRIPSGHHTDVCHPGSDGNRNCSPFSERGSHSLYQRWTYGNGLYGF